jgi:maltooligosyltrehalose trehalohydrolase
VKQFGAVPRADGTTTFRVWAPRAQAVGVRIVGETRELSRADDGTFAGELRAGPGDDYLFVVDGGRPLPDPCSRCQPRGLTGPSRIVDVPHATRLGLALDELVVYELHVGAFSDQGTFDGVAPYLAGLRELGVTAIELMPVAAFPGDRGWGYDGVYVSAPHPAYGGPEGLARLVEAAHREGLGVILDVVYNHIGPGAEALIAFGPYLGDRQTWWGNAVDFSQPAAREWAIQNAEMWVNDYGVDGLRLDAIHAIRDDSHRHVLAELADRVHAGTPRPLVISETYTGDDRPLREWGHDARWSDGLHHALHALLTGEREGYYAPYGLLEDVVSELARHPAAAQVVYAQDHDQIGNRALGDRLAPALLHVASSVVLFSTQTPLLFMGEEYGEESPFQFFTDHIDPRVADAAREGRRREFAAWSAFAGDDVPDPQDPETFRRSKLSRRERPGVRDHYRRLLALRRRLPPEVDVQADGQVLRMRRGEATLVADFGACTVELHG